MLNRKARRAKKTRRPFASDNPADQMKAFLKQPGKFHIVQLPEQKSFVVKVTEAEMPLFLTICQQLRGVLGHCEAIPATPVDASIADTQMIAEDTAQASKRIREARARQDAANPPTLHVVREKTEAERIADDLMTKRTASAPNGVDDDALLAAMERHPAGKGRPASGRHRAAEPETTFDKFASGGVVHTDEERRRLASIEIAAAQAEAARAQDAYEAANQRLRDAYANGGELHNRAVLDKFAEQAGQAIAEANSPEFPDSSAHRCDQPDAAPGDRFRCWCGQAWVAKEHGPLDIRWYHWPERPDQRQNRLIDTAIDVARQDAINDALRQANAEKTQADTDPENRFGYLSKEPRGFA